MSQALDYIEESVTAMISKTAALTVTTTAACSLEMAAAMTENQPRQPSCILAAWLHAETGTLCGCFGRYCAGQWHPDKASLEEPPSEHNWDARSVQYGALLQSLGTKLAPYDSSWVRYSD